MKNYAFREGVDVTVAFSAGAPVDSGQSSNGGSSPIADREVADAIGHRFIPGLSRATVSGAAAPHQSNVVRRLIKSALRTPAKILYRLFKPVIRPIAFRLRAYFLNAVRSEFEDMRQHMTYSRAEALELRKYMRQEAAHLQQAAQAERLKFAIDLSDEFRTTASSLQQDMLARLLPPLGVLQVTTQQLGVYTEALVKAAEAPMQFPQLDRVEQLALEEAKAMAESALAHAQKFERIEQLVLDEARARAEMVPEQSQKLDRIEKLAVEEAKARAETAPAQSLKLDRIEQLALGEAKVRAETLPAQILKLNHIEQLALEEASARAAMVPEQWEKLDRIENLALEEAKARAETAPAQLLKLDRIEQLALGEAKVRAETLPAQVLKLNHIEQLVLEEARARAAMVPEQSQKLDRIEQLGLEEAKARAETVPSQSQKLDRIENLALEEAKARAETAPAQSLKLDRIEQLALGEANVRAETLPAQTLKLNHIEQLALEEAKARAESGPARALKLDRIEQYALSSARRFAINCGGEQVMVRTEVGFLLCSGTDQALLSILIESGELEPGTRRVIQRILKPGDVFIDVGANVGLHTLAAARAMEGQGKIIAFEPFAETARLLEASVWLNGFSSITEIHQAAVSTSTGMQSLYLGGTSGHHSLFPLHAETFRSSRTVEVPLMRIDDVVDEEQSVTLIKIDVEGAELEVLETARQTILRNPAIAIVAEFGPSHLQRTGRKSSEWIAAFTNFGLDYRAINEQSGALESWSIDQLNAVDSINLLFARAGSPIFT